MSNAGEPGLDEWRSIQAARRLLADRSGTGRPMVAASVLTDAGRIHTAVDVDHNLDWCAICAETGALSEALSLAPDARIVFCVALNASGRVMTPTADCLDVLGEYAAGLRVALPAPGDAVQVSTLPALSRRRARVQAQVPLGVILAGGRATRMGGGDKGLRPVAGRRLLDHVIARLRPQVAGMAINANGDPSRFAEFDLPVLPDSIDGHAGPLAGVLAGLDWAAGQGAAAIVTAAADTPFFPPDLVARLQAATGPAGLALAASPDGDGRLQRHPTFGLWPVDLREDLRAALRGGLRKIVHWTEQHAAGHASFPAAPFDPFFNVNTPDDIALAEDLARQA